MPLVPIEELDEQFKPHSSLYNRMINIANGIDPTPREERENRRATNQDNNLQDIEH